MLRRLTVDPWLHVRVRACFVMPWGACVRVSWAMTSQQSLLGAGEKDDRDVIAAIEASKQEIEIEKARRGRGRVDKEAEEEENPEMLKAIAESRCDRGTNY